MRFIDAESVFHWLGYISKHILAHMLYMFPGCKEPFKMNDFAEFFINVLSGSVEVFKYLH